MHTYKYMHIHVYNYCVGKTGFFCNPAREIDSLHVLLLRCSCSLDTKALLTCPGTRPRTDITPSVDAEFFCRWAEPSKFKFQKQKNEKAPAISWAPELNEARRYWIVQRLQTASR